MANDRSCFRILALEINLITTKHLTSHLIFENYYTDIKLPLLMLKIWI